MSDKPLPEVYMDMINIAINEDGVYPHQMIAMAKDKSLQIHAMMVDVPTLVEHFWNKLGESEEVIVGIDMQTRPDQGTHYADALVITYWTRAAHKKLTDPSCLQVGVINYQHEPRIVDAIDWKNNHWDHWVRSVFPKYRPPFLIRVETGQ